MTRILIGQSGYVVFVSMGLVCENYTFLTFDIQPFQGCRQTIFIFRGFTPTVIQIKPIQGFQEVHPVKRDEYE